MRNKSLLMVCMVSLLSGCQANDESLTDFIRGVENQARRDVAKLQPTEEYVVVSYEPEILRAPFELPKEATISTQPGASTPRAIHPHPFEEDSDTLLYPNVTPIPHMGTTPPPPAGTQWLTFLVLTPQTPVLGGCHFPSQILYKICDICFEMPPIEKFGFSHQSKRVDKP